MARLSCVIGNIKEQRANAVVNSANSTLLAGSHVSGAIHKAAGSQLEAARRKISGCEVGQSVFTPAFDLKHKTGADFVIHTVGPRFWDGSRDEASLLMSASRSIVSVCVQLNLGTITIPSISTGIYRYPLTEAAEIAISTLAECSNTKCNYVFVCFDQTTFEAYQSAIGSNPSVLGGE
jgi:O-acetyl-ADP-ribose deacetylase (regulator of RNase III)